MLTSFFVSFLFLTLKEIVDAKKDGLHLIWGLVQFCICLLLNINSILRSSKLSTSFCLKVVSSKSSQSWRSLVFAATSLEGAVARNVVDIYRTQCMFCSGKKWIFSYQAIRLVVFSRLYMCLIFVCVVSWLLIVFLKLLVYELTIPIFSNFNWRTCICILELYSVFMCRFENKLFK